MTHANAVLNDYIDSLPPAAEEAARRRYCNDADVIAAYMEGKPLPRVSQQHHAARRAVRESLKDERAPLATDIRFNGTRWESFVQGEFIAAGPTPRSVQAAHDRALNDALRAAFDNI